MKKLTHKIFCWKAGKKFYLSVRSVRQPKNSVDTRSYKSRQGRNEMANRISKTYNGKAEIVRHTKP